jgi:hypothetical protein
MVRAILWWLAGIASLGFGVVVSVLAVYLTRDARLRRTAVERLAGAACPRCATPIGAALALAAQLDWKERMRQAHAYAAKHGLMIRVDTRFRFDCSACQAALSFDPSELAPVLDHRPTTAG